MRLNVVLDCHNPDALVTFWETALDYRLNEKLDDYRVLVPRERRDPDNGPVFMLSASTDPKAVKNRMHVDVHPDNAETHIARLQRLGGSLVGERVERYGIWWQVMADPEGNEFCVVSGGLGYDEGDASSG
jgi:predicted enzyme related to lactoylglutathione lyase